MASTLPEPVQSVARADDLAVVLDLDGTLIPFAATPEAARLDARGAALVRALAGCPHTQVVIVSGRLKPELDSLFPDPDGPWLVAEHGGWRRRYGCWTVLDLGDATPVGAEARLRAVSSAHPGALVETKTWSVGLHYRGVPESDREGTYIEALLALEGWLRVHPDFELLEGPLVLEVRHRAANKGTAIGWLRGALPRGARIIAFGDDLSDEDTFAALGPDDIAIAVGPDQKPTRAQARLAGVEECRSFLHWLTAVRRAEPTDDPVASTGLHPATRRFVSSLLVVSNRLPEEPDAAPARARAVGGLASGVASALGSRHGVWLGWSGRIQESRQALAIDDETGRASFDLRPDEHALYYNGFANRGLWPVLHGFIGRARFRDAEWAAYVAVNDLFANYAMEVVRRDGVVWAHDFHLLLLARALRTRGHAGPRGLFLHVPFPSIEAFETLPHAAELLAGMLEFDLLGFHTGRHAANFVRAASTLLGATETARGVAHAGRWTQIGVFPLGIDATEFRRNGDALPDGEVTELGAAMRGRKLVLGVDRLDYTVRLPARGDVRRGPMRPLVWRHGRLGP